MFESKPVLISGNIILSVIFFFKDKDNVATLKSGMNILNFDAL